MNFPLSATIKLATSTAEIEQCFPILLQLRPHLQANNFVCQVQSLMKTGYQLAYIHNSQVVGVAGFHLATSLAWSKHLYLEDLVVDRKRQSQGYGEALFTWLIQYAQQHNCQEFHLDSGVQRFAAHRFYLRYKMNISSHHFSLKF